MDRECVQLHSHTGFNDDSVLAQSATTNIALDEQEFPDKDIEELAVELKAIGWQMRPVPLPFIDELWKALALEVLQRNWKEGALQLYKTIYKDLKSAILKEPFTLSIELSTNYFVKTVPERTIPNKNYNKSSMVSLILSVDTTSHTTTEKMSRNDVLWFVRSHLNLKGFAYISENFNTYAAFTIRMFE